VRQYSLGRDLESMYKDEEAIGHYQAAIKEDPNFGRAWAGLANSSSRLGRTQEATAAWSKALSLMGGMTDREKYRTLGVYYGEVSHNFDKAIENYSTLVRLYPADGAGHNNLAMAYFSTLNFQKALEQGKRVLEIYPKIQLYQGNYALYAMYAGDFATASAEARRVVAESPAYFPAYLPLAIAALDSGNVDAAREAYGRMEETGPQGASIASMGLADIALLIGRPADAVNPLKEGVAADRARSDRSGLAAKLAALAEAYDQAGQSQAAAAAARESLSVAPSGLEAVPAARVLIRIGREQDASKVIEQLVGSLQPQNRAWGKVLESEIALRQRRFVEAVDILGEARKLADIWLGRFQMGTAYVQAGYYAEGLSELEQCQKRRGEATALLLNDVPSYRTLATLPYWLGRAKEGLGMRPAALEHYKAFLAVRGAAARDPLVTDARKRAAEK